MSQLEYTIDALAHPDDATATAWIVARNLDDPNNPGNPQVGMTYYNTKTDNRRYWDGTRWVEWGGATQNGIEISQLYEAVAEAGIEVENTTFAADTLTDNTRIDAGNSANMTYNEQEEVAAMGGYTVLEDFEQPFPGNWTFSNGPDTRMSVWAGDRRGGTQCAFFENDPSQTPAIGDLATYTLPAPQDWSSQKFLRWWYRGGVSATPAFIPEFQVRLKDNGGQTIVSNRTDFRPNKKGWIKPVLQLSVGAGAIEFNLETVGPFDWTNVTAFELEQTAVGTAPSGKLNRMAIDLFALEGDATGARLQSLPQVANKQPSEVFVKADVKGAPGNLNFSVSRDNGTTFTNTPLNTWTSIDAQPAGTQMVLRADDPGDGESREVRSWTLRYR